MGNSKNSRFKKTIGKCDNPEKTVDRRLEKKSTYMGEEGRPLNLEECRRRQCSECDARKDKEHESGDEVHK